MLMYVYPESTAKSPSRYLPVNFRMTVAMTSSGLIWTYSSGQLLTVIYHHKRLTQHTAFEVE